MSEHGYARYSWNKKKIRWYHARKRPLRRRTRGFFMKKTICIGSSVSFYKEVASIRKALSSLGFMVLVPDVAEEMEKLNDFDEQKQRDKYQEYSAEMKKRVVTYLFEKIEKSDAFLVVNKEKHGIKGYIGPNVLMEIAIAVYLGKPIFLLSDMGEELSAFGEISALQPIVINTDLTKIQNYFAS